MSENMNAVPPPMPGAPPPKKTNWLLGVGVAVAVIVLCICVISLGTIAVLNAMTPQISANLTATICRIQYPKLSSSQCMTWATDITTNHSAEWQECSDASRNASGSTQTDALFACLDKKGLAPGQ